VSRASECHQLPQDSHYTHSLGNKTTQCPHLQAVENARLCTTAPSCMHVFTHDACGRAPLPVVELAMVGALATADELCVWTSCMWGAAQGRKLRQRKGSQLLHEGCRADDEARVHVSQSDVSITTLQAGPTRACFVVGCFFSAKSVERLASNGGVEGESADPVRALCMSARQPEQRAAKNEVSFWVLSVSVSTTD
jgi:hypothetical protein